MLLYENVYKSLQNNYSFVESLHRQVSLIDESRLEVRQLFSFGLTFIYIARNDVQLIVQSDRCISERAETGSLF